MKIFKMILTCLVLVCGCQGSPEADKQSVSEIKASVDSLLTNWHEAAAEADYDAYFGAMDSVSIFIGTDATEYWTKEQFEAFSKPYFDKGKAWNFKALDRNIYVSRTGDVVWFDEILDTWMGTCRGSGVLEKAGNEWEIKHYVLSIAIPNNDLDMVIQAKSKNDSIFLRKFH